MMKPSIIILTFFFVFFACEEKENPETEIDNSTIEIVNLENNEVLEGSVLIECQTNDNSSIEKVILWINGDSTEIVDYNPPFILNWNTINHINGSYEIYVRSYLDTGEEFDSESIIVKINNFLTYHISFGSDDENEVGYSAQQNQDSSFVILGGIGDDILLMKYDRYGVMKWETSFGGGQLDIATHIQKTSDGGYVISGTTESYGQGYGDIWLIKTDNSGLIEWNTYLGSEFHDSAGQVLETEDGGFILVGSRGVANDGNSDLWLIRTNSQGDSLWTKSFGGNEPDFGSDILIDENGGFIILGSTASQGSGGLDIWLIKTDKDGNEEWNKYYGEGSDDMGQSILGTYDNGYMIQYLVDSYGEGGSSVGLLRLGMSGEEIWTKTIGGSDGISGRSLQKVSQDEYIMACSLFDYGENGYDAYLIKLNDSGDIIWDSIFGEQENDKGFSVTTTLDGGFLLIGSSNNFGNGNKNFSDLLMIKTDSYGNSNINDN